MKSRFAPKSEVVILGSILLFLIFFSNYEEFSAGLILIYVIFYSLHNLVNTKVDGNKWGKGYYLFIGLIVFCICGLIYLEVYYFFFWVPIVTIIGVLINKFNK